MRFPRHGLESMKPVSGGLSLLLALLLAAIAATAAAQDASSSSVGAPQWIRDLVLPGPELTTKATDVKTPVVLRIAAVYPHGTEFRYDLVYYGLDPGEYDLREFLERRDGSSTEDLPAIPVRVDSVLPPGQVLPHRPEGEEVTGVGGYSLLLWGAGALWALGLVAILTVGRKRHGAAAAEHARPKTLAERLRPLVEEAMAGTLSGEDRAVLELALIAFWREKLGLESATVAESLATLKEHDEAGPLVRRLEEWLHHPAPDRDVDVAALLSPYQDLPAEQHAGPFAGQAQE